MIFSLFTNSLAEGEPGVLGPWTALADTEPAGISFGEGQGSSLEPGEPRVPVWLSDLPEDSALIERGFDQAEASLETIQTALEASGVQVETMIRRQASGTSFAIPQPSSEPSSFDLLPTASAMAVGLPQLEREKLAAEQSQRLLQLERDTLGMLTFSITKEETPGGSFPSGTRWNEVSFGLIDDISDKWDQATHQFQDFMERLGQVLSHFAWVETRTGGQLMVRTSIDWNGDMTTAWQIQPIPEQVHQHERTLQLALASRIMLLRTFAAVAANAARLSVLVAAPGGAILALPTSLNLINRIINEQERYKQQIKEIQNGN